MNYAPHDYQKRAIAHIVSRACAALFLDPGLGKTSIMYAAFSLLKKKNLARRMLVIAPLRPAQSVWPGEQTKWADFAHLRVQVLHGEDKERMLRRPADVDVINPEGLPWLLAQRFGEWPWDVLCVDESTRFKHHNTQRFKLLKPVLPRFARRYILTGSPAPNGLIDLFGQVFILDLGNALGRYITHYRIGYFTPSGFGNYTWTPQPDAEERIYKKLGPLSLRMAAEDYLKMPPLVGAAHRGGAPSIVQVKLPPAALKTYKQMEQLFITELAEGAVVAANAAAATNKCRQIANGGLYTDADPVHLHDAKTDAVEELIEELSGVPALVAYEFDHDRERLQKRFKDAPHIGGGVTAKRFREIEGAWNRGDIPVLLAQPQSVAHGLNLQGTRAAVVWAGLTWNLEDYEQLIARVWRQGQKEPVFVHHVVAQGTVDEVILKSLGKKDRTQRALLDALKEAYL